MVAIKIQSKEDIIGAYLCSLGFAGRELPSIVKTVAGQLDFQSADGDELVGKIDSILLEMARKTFPESGLADEQLLAQFKLCFLLCGGAEQCTVQGIRQLNLPAGLTKAMRERFIVNAPACHYTEMKPQKIESFRSRKRKKK